MIMKGLSTKVAESYLESLKLHIAYVQEAGKLLGVPDNQLEIHDQSKYSEYEFPHYANQFFGVKNSTNFAYAWNHHIHNNPHHWQHWIFSDGYNPEDSNLENGAMIMPENYALEMIADWMGAEMAYGGSWDMTKWVESNYNRIKLHTQTREYVTSVLKSLGYNL